jgi:hypothetical protein
MEPQRLRDKVTLCISASVFALCLCGSYVFAQNADRWPNEFPPRALAARPVNFPPYQMQTMPNGLRIIAVAHHENPIVSLRLLVGAGASVDPKGKTGLAHLAASLLDQGTTSATAGQLADEIDFIGGGLSTGAGTDLSYVNMIVMKDSFERALQMLSDVARHPAFAQDEIARQKQQLLSSLQVSFRIRLSWPTRSSTGSSTVSIRTDCRRAARQRRSRRSPATTCSASTRSISGPTTRSSPSSATSSLGRRSRASGACSPTGSARTSGRRRSRSRRSRRAGSSS